MTFREAIESTGSIKKSYRTGIAALKPTDRARISIADPRLLTGSIDLDTALSVSQPNAARWDYGIGWKKSQKLSETISWVEVHPMKSETNLAEVERKLIWLKNWLAGDGHRLNKLEREFVCISSGESSFTASSPQLRKLAQRGLRTVGRHLKLA